MGPVRRPSLLHLRPGCGGRAPARPHRPGRVRGDDGFLAAIVKILGEEGFRVIGAHEILTEAVGPKGLLTTAAPDAMHWPTSPARPTFCARWRRGRGAGGCGPARHRARGRGDRGHGRHARPRRQPGPPRPRRRAGQDGQAGARSPRRPAHDRPAHDRGRPCRRSARRCVRGRRHAVHGPDSLHRTGRPGGLFLLGLDPTGDIP